MDLTSSNQIVELSWLARPSVKVAPELLGCTLVRRLPSGETLCGLIVETEAYAPDDPAFHAYRRRTERNWVVFGPAGRCYVYRIYRLYHCFNIVTDREGTPSTVLIRALQLKSLPSGLDSHLVAKPERVAAGPGKLCNVMQIDRSLNGGVLQFGESIWLEHRSDQFQQQLNQGAITLTQTTRIGITQGVDLPWRWYISNCPAVSKQIVTSAK